MRWTPTVLKNALNMYGPYLGAGVKITHIDPEWKLIRTRMKLRWYNRNIMGTHFGGSLYAMVDPQIMLILMNRLGKAYIVWDQAASIEFIKPGRGTVEAVISVSDERIEEIRAEAEAGAPVRPEFSVEIRDLDGELVSRVQKTLYVRKKQARPQS